MTDGGSVPERGRTGYIQAQCRHNVHLASECTRGESLSTDDESFFGALTPVALSGGTAIGTVTARARRA